MNYIYYNMTRRIGLALVACMLPLAMFSQSGPELLRVNPDARSAAMGDASLGRAERMYIYTNPSAIFPTDCRLDASVSFMGHAKFQGVDGRQWGTAVGLAGKVVLLPPPGIRLSSSSLEVKLAAGDVSVTKVQMDGKIVPGTVIRAVLTVEGGRRYRSGVALFPKVSRVWAAGTVKLPAASLVSETGGRVSVVRGRPGAADGCMIAWDNAGHRISWQLNLPAAGRYQLLLSRATPMDVERRLSVNGREIGVFQFSSTGGFGNDKTEWVLSECGPVLELKSGVNTITLENTNGSSMNLAYLYCEPVKK